MGRMVRRTCTDGEVLAGPGVYLCDPIGLVRNPHPSLARLRAMDMCLPSTFKKYRIRRYPLTEQKDRFQLYFYMVLRLSILSNSPG